MRVEEPNATLVREKLREMAEKMGGQVTLTDRETKTGSRETTIRHETGRFTITLVDADADWYMNVEHDEEHSVSTYTNIESFSYTLSNDKAIPHKIVIDMDEWNL